MLRCFAASKSNGRSHITQLPIKRCDASGAFLALRNSPSKKASIIISLNRRHFSAWKPADEPVGTGDPLRRKSERPNFEPPQITEDKKEKVRIFSSREPGVLIQGSLVPSDQVTQSIHSNNIYLLRANQRRKVRQSQSQKRFSWQRVSISSSLVR
jgi:hypothetical protein